jgi:hypothetical protein
MSRPNGCYGTCVPGPIGASRAGCRAPTRALWHQRASSTGSRHSLAIADSAVHPPAGTVARRRHVPRWAHRFAGRGRCGRGGGRLQRLVRIPSRGSRPSARSRRAVPPPVPPPPAPPAQAAVRRDGAVHPIRVTDVVPGDVVVLCEGDSIPADSRLLSGAVDVDMSMLTGESHPVARSTQTGSTPVRRTTRVEAAQVPDPVAGAGEQLRTQRHENGRVGDGRTRKVCNVDPAAGPGRELLGTLRVADWPYRRWSEMGKGERGSVGSACRCRLVAHGRERPRVRGIRGTRRPKSRQTRVRSDACRL